MKQIPKSHLIVVFCAFVVSGLSGLIYQSLWSHYLGLYLGHAALAQTLTLAIFMGGMALGAWFIGSRINQIKNAVLVYAIVEAVLGLMGLVFHGVFDATIHMSFEVIFPAIGSPSGIHIIKWLIASMLILPQSILLGATFPLLSSGIIRRAGKSEGGMISSLYFTNSLGASFGAILSTFILVPKMGMPGALLVAGILNFIVAIAVYYVAKNKEPEFKDMRSKELGSTHETIISTRLILLVAGFTGFASFIYEIAWIRMLNLVFGTTVHSFEIMLSSFILGLALGGLWIRKRIDNIQNIAKYLGVIQIFMAIMAILTMPLYIESFTWVAEILQNVLRNTDTGYTFYNILTATMAILIMMPAAFFADMTLPLLTMVLMKQGYKEQSISKVYTVNTVGSLFGVWFAIHVGMVFLGLKYLIVLGSFIDFVLGTYLLLKASGKKVNVTALGVPAVYAVVFLFVVLLSEFSPRTLASGTYRYARDSFAEKTDVLFYEDGKSASISVISEKNNSGEDMMVIATNGKPDAGLIISSTNYSGDEPTMILAGGIPLLVKPEAKLVANIGFGSGLTTNTLLGSEQLEQLDTIEIEPEMVNGARLFGAKNSRVFKDKRSRIVIDDAKTFFATNNKKYDLIVSEPSNPWVMGVGNLFTENFYRHIKNYLKEDGILVQWLQLYEISPRVIASAYNAIGQEFNYFDLYRSNVGDVIMLVSDRPIPDFQYNDMNQLPELLQQDFRSIGIEDLSIVKSRKAGSQEQMRPLFKYLSASVNSDYFPELSLKAPKDRFKKENSGILFAYTAYGLPMFEYIFGENLRINKTTGQFDKYHPYLNLIEKSENILQVFNGDKNPLEAGITVSTLGYIKILKNDKLSCGEMNEKMQLKWMSALMTILNNVAPLGSDVGLQIMDSETVVTCAQETNSKKLFRTISSIRMFFDRKYNEYLNEVSSEFYKRSELNIGIKSHLYNYGLFAIMVLKQQGEEVHISIDQYLADNKDNWSEHTPWLISQILDEVK